MPSKSKEHPQGSPFPPLRADALGSHCDRSWSEGARLVLTISPGAKSSQATGGRARRGAPQWAFQTCRRQDGLKRGKHRGVRRAQGRLLEDRTGTLGPSATFSSCPVSALRLASESAGRSRFRPVARPVLSRPRAGRPRVQQDFPRACWHAGRRAVSRSTSPCRRGA